MHAFPFLASKRFDEVRFEDQLVEQRRFDELLQRLDQQRPKKVCSAPDDKVSAGKRKAGFVAFLFSGSQSRRRQVHGRRVPLCTNRSRGTLAG